MRYLFVPAAALMLVTVVSTAPAQAQQRRVQTQQRAHQQPRAFSKHFKNQAAWNRTYAQARFRPNTGRRSAISPRFYAPNVASRTSQRLRYRHLRVTRARANVSPRRVQPRFYNAQSAANASERIRLAQRRAQRARNQAALTRRAATRRVQPTFWK